MSNLVTLIIIIHNRHQNLERLVHYYKDSSIPIIIADSSARKYEFKETNLWKYFYTPGITYTQKIEIVLKEVTTPYVVMCADDDFIIPESILNCVNFLEANKDYSIAQGNCIAYIKESINSSAVEFRLIYTVDNYDIDANDAFTRLEKMFEKYRSVLYAVHRTNILKLAFNDTGGKVKNLYLNEYQTAIVPIISGKYKELDGIYQVREFALDSDDKVTDNIDKIFEDSKYKNELNSFIDLCAEKASSIMHLQKTVSFKKIFLVLERFSKSSSIVDKSPKITLKKRVGLLIQSIPIVGSRIIKRNRRIENEIALKQVIKTQSDKDALARIETVLKSFASKS